MHFNTPKSKRRISIKKKRYTVNLSINLKGNVGNISMFVEILLWFNVISNRFVLLKRQVFLFIYTYTKYNRFVISFEANSKDERIYISISSRSTFSLAREFINLFFLPPSRKCSYFSWKSLPISSTLFVPKNFDRFSPIKGNLSSNIYIYRYLSVAQY